MQINADIRLQPAALPRAASVAAPQPADSVQLQGASKCPFLNSMQAVQATAAAVKAAPSSALAATGAAAAAKAVAPASFAPAPAVAARLMGVEFQREGRGLDFWHTKWKPASAEQAIESTVNHEPTLLRAPGSREWLPVSSLEELKTMLAELERTGAIQSKAKTGQATAAGSASALSGCPFAALQEAKGSSEKVGLLEFIRGAARHTTSPARFIQEFHAKHGPSFQVDIPTKGHFLFESRPEALQTVLSNTDSGQQLFGKSKMQAHGAAFLMGETNMFTSGGEEWNAIHEAMKPLFSGQVLHTDATVSRLSDIFDDHLNDLAERVKKAPNGELEIDARSEMQNIVLDVAVQLFLGSKLPKTELQDMKQAFKTQMDWLTTESANPTNVSLSKLPGMGGLKDAYQTLGGAADKMIADRRQSGKPGDDLLGALMKMTDPETGQPLDDERLRHELVAFMEAGHETTATLIGWNLLMMAHNPDEFKKLQAQVDQNVGSQRPNLHQLNDMEQVGNTVNESLRLFPPFYMFMREAKEDTNVGGVDVPKGSTVVSSLFDVQRDEHTWGVEKTGYPANEFHPERFEEKNPARMFAFGAGKRACPGQALGRLEAELMSTRFAQKFDILAASGAVPLDIKSDLSIHPKDGKITIKLRETPPATAPTQGFQLSK